MLDQLGKILNKAVEYSNSETFKTVASTESNGLNKMEDDDNVKEFYNSIQKAHTEIAESIEKIQDENNSIRRKILSLLPKNAL